MSDYTPEDDPDNDDEVIYHGDEVVELFTTDEPVEIKEDED